MVELVLANHPFSKHFSGLLNSSQRQEVSSKSMAKISLRLDFIFFARVLPSFLSYLSYCKVPSERTSILSRTPLMMLSGKF